ncbi:Ubiquitin carboxyl-terminal hydrolase 18, partial [Tetrabaena socialis]
MYLACLLILVLIWIAQAAFKFLFGRGDMDTRPAGAWQTPWNRREPAAVAPNWWDVANDRQPQPEELVSEDTGEITPVTPNPSTVCLQCGQLIPVPKTCGRCKLAAYCSRECQQKHWGRHKLHCERLQRDTSGVARPAPDPPLVLPSQPVFNGDSYRALLELHRRIKASAASQPGGDDDGAAAAAADGSSEPPSDVEEAPDARQPLTGAGGAGDAEGGAAAAALSGANGLSWAWNWPPSDLLLTPRRPAGILNTGNSCYAACAVQCLLATPALGEYLRSGAHCDTCGAPPATQGLSSWCPACELSNLAAQAAQVAAAGATGAQRANGNGDARTNGASAAAVPAAAPPPSAWGRPAAKAAPEDAPGGGGGGGGGGARYFPVDARGLTRQVHRLNRTLLPGRQEDANELLMKLLEALAEVQVAEAGGRTTLRAQARAAAARAAAGASSPVPPLPWRGDETSLVHHCLGGYLRRATICDVCGHVSQSHECILSLEVDLTSRVHSVDSGLRSYFADEVLDSSNQYKCERCRQKVCATRRVRVEVAPNVLVLCLKRFIAQGPRMAKNNKDVQLRLDLDLSPYMAESALDGGAAAYRLYAVVQHVGLAAPGGLLGTSPGQGSLTMGHYVAVVRGAEGAGEDDEGGGSCWHHCDDDEITEVRRGMNVSESDVADIRNAYMLFYHRVEPRLPAAAPPKQRQEPQPATGVADDGLPEPSEAGDGVDAEPAQAQKAAEAVEPAVAEAVSAASSAASPEAPSSPAGSPPAPAPALDAPSPPAPAGEGPPRPPALDGAAPEWAAWAAVDDEPPSAAAASHLLRRPQHRLLPPREGPGAPARWTLLVRLPGVKSARDIKMAATRCPGAPDPAAPHGAGGGGFERSSSRVRCWVAGSYNLDLELALRPAGAGGQLEVAEVGAEVESPGAAAGFVEVLVPRWSPSRSVLRIPLQLHA